MQMIRCTKCMMEIGEEDRICPHCGYEQNRDNQPGNALKKETILRGRYLVGNVIGQGGFGITYVGYDLTLEMKIAIKEYFPAGSAMRTGSYSSAIQWSFGDNGEQQWSDGIERFLTEARKMAKLDSVPSIVRVRDAFRENETAYIVMDFIEGETLKSYLLKHGVMDYQSCMKLLSPVLESLAVIHNNGFIHRDISPDNIMIQPDGTARLLDMGAAVDVRANDGHASMAVVKRNFSAPEQYMDEALGSWTDVYAMAATIYYCLTGKVVPEAMEREFKKLSIDFPQEYNIPSYGAQALNKALELKAEKRIRNMREFKRLLTESEETRTSRVSTEKAAERGTESEGSVQNKRKNEKPGKKKTLIRSAVTIVLKIALVIVAIPFACFLFFFIKALIGPRSDSPQEPSQTTEAVTTAAIVETTTAAETTAVSAESETEVGGEWYDQKDEKGFYTFNDDGTCTLELWIDDSELCLRVPSEFQGRTITGIGDYAFMNLSMEQIRFPDTIKVIGDGALDQCNNLQAVFLPSSIEEIQGPLLEEYDEDHCKIVFFVGRQEDEIKDLDWCDNWQGIENMTSCYFEDVANQADIQGWRQDHGEEWMYYEDGFAKFGWHDIDGKTYGFDIEGVAITGWGSSDDGTEYYFDEKDCYLVKGWREIEGKLYYFDMDDGHLLKSTTTPDGYEVNDEGVFEMGGIKLS